MPPSWDLKSVDRKVVRVRLPPSAPINLITYKKQTELGPLSNRISSPLFGKRSFLPGSFDAPAREGKGNA